MKYNRSTLKRLGLAKGPSTDGQQKLSNQKGSYLEWEKSLREGKIAKEKATLVDSLISFFS